jgi:hypothetical protein
MGSSILEQYWFQQEKQRSLFPSTGTNIPTIDEPIDRIINRSDVFSLEYFAQKDPQSNSNHLLPPSSSSNIRLKEFCPIKKEEEEEDEEESSFKRFVYHQKKKTLIFLK